MQSIEQASNAELLPAFSVLLRRAMLNGCLRRRGRLNIGHQGQSTVRRRGMTARKYGT